MQPHSTTEQVEKRIMEVKREERIYITTPDARAICSWYQEPNANPYLLQFVQGQNVNSKALLLEVLELAQEMFQDDPAEHFHLLYVIAFLGMRVGMTAIIEAHE